MVNIQVISNQHWESVRGTHYPHICFYCAEGLSAPLRDAEMTNKIHGVAICRGGPKISHLLFADDSLLFCHAKVDECMRLLAVLEKYEKASG